MRGLKKPQLKSSRPPQRDEKCAGCGGLFYRWREWQVYCSDRCRNRHFYLNRKAELERLRGLEKSLAS